MTGYVITTYLSITKFRREKEMSIEDQNTTFGMRKKNEKKEKNNESQNIDQTAHTPRERMILALLVVVLVGMMFGLIVMESM